GEKDIYTVTFQDAAHIAGRVYSMHDSTAIAGVEVKFVGVSQDRKPLGYQKSIKNASEQYELNVLAGNIYQGEIIKDNKVIAKEEVRVPLNKDKSAVLTSNFYVDYGAKPKEKELIAAVEPEKLLASAEPVAVVEPVVEEILVQPTMLELQKP